MSESLALGALVFLLGVRHGFDPDHLVAIDGLARSRLGRWCGVLFSLGHGGVVTLIGIAAALAASEWQAPQWLEPLGACVSAGFLALLGFANLQSFFRGQRRLVGLRGRRWAERLERTSHPLIVAAIGAAFALSFDTISHALLFSATGAASSGWVYAALLGVIFTLGMALTDGLNGWWVGHLMRRAEGAARYMSLAIGLLCFAFVFISANIGLAPLLSVGTIAVILAAYLLARRLPIDGTRPQ